MRRVEPAHHHRKFAFRFDPGERTARTDCEIAGGRYARKDTALVVEPDQVAIERCDRTRCQHALQPLAGDDPLTVDAALTQEKLGHLDLVLGADRQAATPM